MIVVSEISHVFCCVLPSIFSILTMMVGLGIMGALPVGLTQFHDMMHGWELTIIITSAAILAFGWALHVISERLDCHNTGCGHEPCTPKKKKTARVLKFATILFLVNVSIYALVHVPQERANAEHAGHTHP